MITYGIQKETVTSKEGTVQWWDIIRENFICSINCRTATYGKA